MAVNHVEMALGHRNIHRFAHGAAGMMQAGRHVGELHEIAEVFDCGIAPAAIKIAHEGRAIDGGENGVLAANDNIVGRVARILRKFPRRRFANAAHQAFRKAHPLALDIGAGIFPQRQGFRIITKINADFLQDEFGVVLDKLKLVIGKRFIELDIAANVTLGRHHLVGSRSAPRISATTAPRTATCWSGL